MAGIFTIALGLPAFSRLMNRLGLVDIFAPSTTASCLEDQVLEPSALDLRESVKLQEKRRQKLWTKYSRFVKKRRIIIK